MASIRRAAVLAALPVLFVAAGCGGSSSGVSGSTTTTTTAPGSGSTPAAEASAPADPAAAKAEITTNWEKFFSSTTDAATAKALLEDGDQLGPALKKAEQEDKASGGTRSAKVTKITFSNATSATVNYKLHVGQTNLNSAGMAVLQDGIWKVSKVTFCTLVELGNGQKPVASC